MLCNGSEQDLTCSCICYIWGFYLSIVVSKGTFMQWWCTKNGNILPLCSSHRDNIVKRPLFTGIHENNLKHCIMHARPCKNAHFVYTETIMESISQTCTLKPVFKSLHFQASKTPLSCKWTVKWQTQRSVLSCKWPLRDNVTDMACTC